MIGNATLILNKSYKSTKGLAIDLDSLPVPWFYRTFQRSLLRERKEREGER